MIVLILFFIGLLVFAGVLMSCFFERKEETYYDPKGKGRCEFKDVKFKSDEDEARARAEVSAAYRKRNNLKANAEVSDYNIKYMEVPTTTRTRIVPYHKDHWYYCDFENARGLVGWIGVVVFFLAVAISGGISIAHNGPMHQEEYATKLTVALDDLHDRQETIYLTLSGDLNFKVNDGGTVYHVLVDKPLDMMNTINNYNTDVKAFKQELYLEKVRLASPWVNTFINPGFKRVDGYNDNARNYKEILGDNLKTFELKSINE